MCVLLFPLPLPYTSPSFLSSVLRYVHRFFALYGEEHFNFYFGHFVGNRMSSYTYVEIETEGEDWGVVVWWAWWGVGMG